MSKKINFKEIALKAGGAAAGGAGSTLLNRAPVIKDMDSKLRAGVKIVIGAVIPELFPKVKILDSVGNGMIGAATAELVEEILPAPDTKGKLDGIGEDPQFDDEQFITDPEIHGPGEEHLSGTDQEVINGGEDFPNVVVE